MLELRDVTVPGRERPRLCGLSLSLKPGERVALVGASGAGQSTLLGVANGLIQPTSGSVQWFGEPRLRRRLRSRIGTLWQDLRLNRRTLGSAQPQHRPLGGLVVVAASAQPAAASGISRLR